VNRDALYTMRRPDGVVRLVTKETPQEQAIGLACEEALKAGRIAISPHDVRDPSGAAQLWWWREHFGVKTLIHAAGEFRVAKR
jgi:hypothetical protein